MAVQRRAAPPPAPQARVRTRSQGSKPVAITAPISGTVEVNGLEVERLQTQRRLPTSVISAAVVMVRGGITVSPQQYESVRIDVSLSLPTAPEPEAYEAAYAEATTWVERKLAEQVAASGGRNG